MATNNLVMLDPTNIYGGGDQPELVRSVSTPHVACRRGQTPLWNTFESMLSLADLSDSQSDENDNDVPALYDDSDSEDDIKASISTIALKPATKNHLNIKNDKIVSRPKLCSSVSVPIRQMKTYQITTITIWSNHKQELAQLLHKKSSKNLRFKDVENVKDEKMKDNVQQTCDIRKYLMNEIIDTEKSYVQGLNTLLYEFVIPFIDKKFIDLTHKETITCNIPEILMFHTQFLKQLVEATCDENKKEKKTFVAVFSALCNQDFVEMYTKYAKGYQRMLDVYAKYKFDKSKKLQKYLKEKRKERKPLTNFLILPIQRVTRYLLLLQELKQKTPAKHNDYKELEVVLDKINETVNEINERQREIECMSQCLQVQETMYGLDKNIVEPHRKLLAQFIFRKKANQRARQFFLFNDILIITNVKFKVKALIEMRTIDIKQVKNSELEFHLYSVHHEAIYETDLDKTVDMDDFLCLVEDNRSLIHQETLRSVGADDIATLLNKRAHSVSGSSLKKFRGNDTITITSSELN